MGEDMNPYNMSEIKIEDEIVLGRPVEWDSEPDNADGSKSDGTYIEPIKYETTCPYCGSLISYESKFLSVQCQECGKGEFEERDPVDHESPVDLDIELTDIEGEEDEIDTEIDGQEESEENEEEGGSEEKENAEDENDQEIDKKGDERENNEEDGEEIDIDKLLED